jgi:transcriptional regulator with XRE-family HTH domain
MTKAEGRLSLALQFSRNLKCIRLREGLSQEELARRASLHRTEIGHLESGRRVCGIEVLMRLAGAMAVTPNDLLDGIFWVTKPEAVGAFSFNRTAHAPLRSGVLSETEDQRELSQPSEARR